MKIDYAFVAHCYERYYECIMEDTGKDAYFQHGRNHAYVIGLPLSAESNCFIISGKFLISLWFDPIEKNVYGELRYSPDYVVHASGICSMRNMKISGTLVEYPALCFLSRGALTRPRIDNWLASACYKTALYHRKQGYNEK